MPNYILTSARKYKTFLNDLIFLIRKNTKTSRPRVNCQPSHRGRAQSAEVLISLHSSIYSQSQQKSLSKHKKSQFFNFFIIFLTPMKNLPSTSLPSKIEFQKLILSQNKLPYKIQFLRKSQLETIRLFSTIDFFRYAKSSKCSRPARNKIVAAV